MVGHKTLGLIQKYKNLPSSEGYSRERETGFQNEDSKPLPTNLARQVGQIHTQ